MKKEAKEVQILPKNTTKGRFFLYNSRNNYPRLLKLWRQANRAVLDLLNQKSKEKMADASSAKQGKFGKNVKFDQIGNFTTLFLEKVH